VLYGNNGAGKTNFLEAISIFSGTRGLRGARFDEMMNVGVNSQSWGITLSLDNEEFSVSYTTRNGRGKRMFNISGKRASSLAEFKDNYYVLWITQEVDRLFLQSPSDRRDFIDMFAESEYSNHSYALSSFENLSRQRLRILKESGGEVGCSHSTSKWLDILESKIAEFGYTILKNRIEVIKKMESGQSLIPSASKFSAEMTGKAEDIICTIDDSDCNDSASKAKQRYVELLMESRTKDFFVGFTSIGPNRSDWNVLNAKNGMRAALCSAGEQKSLLCNVFFSFVSRKMYEDKRGLILILDDVASYLDSEHRMFLFDQIKSIRQHFEKQGVMSSVWLSGTDRDQFSPLDGCAGFFHVKDGNLLER
jgi:DNA replication and repair protein RecF